MLLGMKRDQTRPQSCSLSSHGQMTRAGVKMVAGVGCLQPTKGRRQLAAYERQCVLPKVVIFGTKTIPSKPKSKMKNVFICCFILFWFVFLEMESTSLFLLVQITDPCQSKTPVQENAPRNDKALPSNNNDLFISIVHLGLFAFPSRRQSWPWKMFSVCWRLKKLNTLQNMAPGMWIVPN